MPSGITRVVQSGSYMVQTGLVYVFLYCSQLIMIGEDTTRAECTIKACVAFEMISAVARSVSRHSTICPSSYDAHSVCLVLTEIQEITNTYINISKTS